MIVSDLYTPLPARTDRPRRRVPPSVLAILALAVTGGAAALVLCRADGARGEPSAVGTIGPATVSPPIAARLAMEAPAPVTPPDEAAPAAATQQIRMENGVMVIRGVAADGPSPTRLSVPDLIQPKGAKTAEAQLIEPSSAGPLPRIGRDGRRPSAAYAGAPVAAGSKPRIAVIIGGMGLDQASTARAAQDLPASVTFGFAPYGEDLSRQVGAARAAGHEVVLQMPMEDVGRDDTAFPHMLKTGAGNNAERLRWLMSRFTGYAGVANYLGGRLLADEGSVKAVLGDVAARGLYFVDDGTAPRSLTAPVSHDLALPYAKADVVIDARTDVGAVATALEHLEKIARARGFALGSATARPATNALIERYLAEAIKRGIAVVPVSQIATLPPAVAVNR